MQTRGLRYVLSAVAVASGVGRAAPSSAQSKLHAASERQSDAGTASRQLEKTSRSGSAPARFEARCGALLAVGEVGSEATVPGDERAGCAAQALAAFTTAYHAQQRGRANGPLRIIMIGDSTTADDEIPAYVRAAFAAQIGDGGPGYVPVLPAHPYNQLRSVARTVSGWRGYSLLTAIAPDKRMGLAGTTASSAHGQIDLAYKGGTFSSVSVFALGQPKGGAVEVQAPKMPARTISTAGAARETSERLQLAHPTSHVHLQARGNVRLFGVALENDRGIVVDNVGIVNGTAKLFLRNAQAHWQTQLAARHPDLVVLMLGTNEAEWLPARGKPIEEHESRIGTLLHSVRQAAPQAACLVISPFDQLDWRVPGLPARASVPSIVAAQRRAAFAHGCAFWDAYAWMGGARSSLGWQKRGWLMRDFQHRTTAGSSKIGAALVAGLRAQLGTEAPLRDAPVGEVEVTARHAATEERGAATARATAQARAGQNSRAVR